jgi:hypothetical protein
MSTQVVEFVRGSLTSLILQELVERLGCPAVHRRSDVAVEIQGHAHLRVPEQLRDDLRVDTLAEQQCGGRIPEVSDLDAEAILRSIDLRTVDLSPRRPAAGLVHGRADKALGLRRQLDGSDIPLPPLPGRGLDAGPDLGP